MFAQQDDLRLGMGISPTITWMSSNDNQLTGEGSTSGFRIMVLGEKYFRENYAFSGSVGISTNQGGTLQHKIGGNYWPNSDLSDPALNEGEKPLPDGVELGYHLNYLEFQAI